MTTRSEMLQLASDILKANPDPKPATVRVRYRGSRPVFNWHKKYDAKGAACLWMVARERLPMEAANDNEPTKEMGVDRRKDGKPRGKNPDPRSLDAYLALPHERPRLGDVEPRQTPLPGWFPWFDMKPQREVFDFHPDCRFGFCAPAIAEGAIFLGAIGGLGQPKMGKRRGAVRQNSDGTFDAPPLEVETVIEVMLAGGTVSDVGKALGARGAYSVRRGGAAILAAGKWAERIVLSANDNLSRSLKKYAA